ncbi:MAG TPA: hypothetical protein VMT54_08560 [Candidatus Cybelea sp.]|nr:hypothetical protein [Candidatus Cybelea sp.]
MIFNPEFRRNVWVQFTWPKLLAAPLVTIIVTYAFLIVKNNDYRLLQNIAELIGAVIVGLWGTRRAADALAEEVSGGTWESQRMSGLGAWQMTWGKLIGSAGFVWYCAAMTMIVIFWAASRIEAVGGIARPGLQVAFEFIVGGLMAQSVAFVIALLLLRKAAQHRRLTITLAQSCGFLLFFFLVRGGFLQHSPGLMQQDSADWAVGDRSWYGQIYSTRTVLNVTIACGCFWAVLGAYRLMRTELQYRSLPWVWLLFMLCVSVSVAGFDPWPQLGLVFLALVLLTYLSFFADNRDPVRYRWALLAIPEGDWLQVISAIPWWLISYLLAAALGFAIAANLSAGGGILPPQGEVTPFAGMLWMAQQHMAGSLILVMLFMLRDLLILLWFSCSPWRAKADVAGIIYLALIYWPLAALLWVTDEQRLLPVVVPIATGVPAVDYVPIGIELAFALFLFYARWREITRLKRR